MNLCKEFLLVILRVVITHYNFKAVIIGDKKTIDDSKSCVCIVVYWNAKRDNRPDSIIVS